MAASSASALASLMSIVSSFLLLRLAVADLPVNTIFHGNRTADTTHCQSWWFPTFLQTHNETLFFGACKFGVPSKIGNQGNRSHSRSNYTLRRSDDMGATWQLVSRVYAGGAGYSDAVVMPDGDGHSLAMAFQKTWEPTDPNVEGGGYDMGMARLPL